MSPTDFFSELHRLFDRVEDLVTNAHRHGQESSTAPPASAVDDTTDDRSTSSPTADPSTTTSGGAAEVNVTDQSESGDAGGPPRYDPNRPFEPQVPALAIDFAGEPSEPPPGLGPTKFGGQPDWLNEPAWPISRETGDQMEFIVQLALHPDDFPWLVEPKMVYLFVTNDEFDPGGIFHWDPFAGENAVIVQPGDHPDWVDLLDAPTGPSTQGERRVGLSPRVDPPVIPDDRTNLDRTEFLVRYIGVIDYDKIGGTPNFFQGVEMPVFEDGSTSRDPKSGAIPILMIRNDTDSALNLGDAGRGVAFLSSDQRLGAYLWFN